MKFTFILSLKARIQEKESQENVKLIYSKVKIVCYSNRLNSKQMLNLFCGITLCETIYYCYMYAYTKTFEYFSFILTESFERPKF